MHNYSQEAIQENEEYFYTPQLKDLFQSILREIDKSKTLSCIIGFPKAGKTSFLIRLQSSLKRHAVLVNISSGSSLKQCLEEELKRHPSNQQDIDQFFDANKSIVILVDNAHLMSDKDFAQLNSLLRQACTQKTSLQFVLVGNGELIHRLARPANRDAYNLLATLWNLPKLSREQSLAYIHFLLKTSGLSQDLITNPEVLASRAAGVVGILRMLTITLALKAIGSEENCDARDLVCISQGLDQTGVATAGPLHHTDVRQQSRWIGGILLLSMSILTILVVLSFFWVIPELDLRKTISKTFDSPQTVASDKPDPIESNPETPPELSAVFGPEPLARIVLRKRTNEGPYSLHLGSYPTIESLLLHQTRLNSLNLAMFWSWNELGRGKCDLYAGRFESFERAREVAAQHQLGEVPVAFRPFVVTVGPLTHQNQINKAALIIGLPGSQRIFERELVTGVEIQFALERTHDDAVRQCSVMEKKGLSCAITQYE